MTDIVDQYKKRVQKKLCRAEKEDHSQLAEVLCLPSFHAETLIRVVKTADHTVIRLFSFTSSLWYSDEDDPPVRFQESAVVALSPASEFWNRIETLNPETIRTQQQAGCDGMSVTASYRKGDIEASFSAWSPDINSIPGQFLVLVYGLAWEALKESRSIQRLEQLHNYMGLGVPARIVEGEFTCLRLFGSISAGMEDSLRELFAKLSSEDRLLVDMTNFDGMGTILYPLFIEFAGNQSRVRWVANENARQHLSSIGIAKEDIFSEPESAMSELRKDAK